MENAADLAAHFEGARSHLRAVAFRMLGSADEADDAVQEAWLHASSAELHAIANVSGWLTTIVSRVCLDMLRARRRRRESSDGEAELLAAPTRDGRDPEDEAALADSVGLALLVVLDALGPAERVAFVLHDSFGIPFDAIATIVDRTPDAAKKLASRARRRVHAAPIVPAPDALRHQRIVEAFLAASRAGDVDALVALLAPDAVRRADRAALREDAELEVRGARRIAEETRGNADRARFARVVLVNGKAGAIVAPHGRLRIVIAFTIEGDRITAFDVFGDPSSFPRFQLSLPISI
ncbi:sigma-70 family RNA polymerase sigma factor [Pendulispora brunnea]|uniref:Sigma-70 family RNA polymerase sigma factor n=1 Tax=Pendulispora brunnea TaxID=2905690 RepID=A0ABZ2JY55_9BACT